MQQPFNGIIVNYICSHIQPKTQLWNDSDKGQLVEAHVFLFKRKLIWTESLNSMYTQHNCIIQVVILFYIFSDRTLLLSSFPGFSLLENYSLLYMQNFNFTSNKTMWRGNTKAFNTYCIPISIFISTWCTI